MASPLDFRHLLEHSPNAYMVLDRELRYVWANPAYLEVTGSRLDDLVGRNIFAVFPHDEADASNESARRLRDSFERVLATGARDVLAFIRYRVPTTPDGAPEERLWSTTNTPVPDGQGGVAYILQHTVDVTKLRRARSAHTEAGVLERAARVQEANVTLDAERRHLRSLFEQAPGFMAFLRGPEHVFELANHAYYQVVGHRDIIGKPSREALPDVQGQGFFELLDGVFQTGERFVGRGVMARIQRRPNVDPDELFLDFVFEPIHDERGAVTGIFIQGHDVTMEKRLEMELERLLERERQARGDAEIARAEAERANRLKDEFLATLSHELRTPLNALLGWARILRTRPLDEDMQRRASEVIERNAALQAQLVEDILDVSRIITGKLRLEIRPVDIRTVVDAAVEIVRPAADARGVRLETPQEGGMLLPIDAKRLQQAVWNLLSNAVKFTPPGGTVRVGLACRERTIELTVADTGVGIESDFLPYVFDRFRQAEGGFDRAHGGLGLGLAIVKHVIEAHGGEVDAFSEGRDRGATFTVRLPVATPAHVREEHATPVAT